MLCVVWLMCSLQQVIPTTQKNRVEPIQIRGLPPIIRVIRETTQNSTCYSFECNDSQSETANILNALKETPSAQPGASSSKSSIKRSSDPSSRVSRFDKKQENEASFQPLMKLSLSKNNPSKTMTSSAADWRVCRTAEGVEYYYNQRTRAKTYEKPDVLKSEAELSLKVGSVCVYEIALCLERVQDGGWSHILE